MRTFRILAAGWALGGAVIVALSGNAGVPPAGSATSRRPELRRDAARPAGEDTGGPLRVPVLGISREQLLDTFTQARGGGRTHNAIDIQAPRGTPVVAVVDGTVRKLFNSRAGGLTIYQFDLEEERLYYYAHLDRYADGLQEGARITAGTVIGYVGTTGNAPADTPHLHFAVEVLPPTKEWWKGVAVNPYPLLTRPASALR